MLVLWITVFIVSLITLIKGADWLIENAEKIGLAMGLSPFLVGVLIVGAGTSFPELISSSVAAYKGLTDVAVANVIGSNIANILLIVGISAVVAKKLVVTKSLIDLDLPLLAIGTVLLFGCAVDGKITLGESILLLVSYLVYLFYTVIHKDEIEDQIEKLPSRQKRRKTLEAHKQDILVKPKLGLKNFLFLGLGLVMLILGAKYLIDALINLSSILNIATGVITITAVAIGTSLPELMVSIKAAAQKKTDVALGNIFGSNIFNALVVVGFSGLFGTLTVDSQTLAIGLPTMIIVTVLFVISGISKRIHIWEGLFYLAVYVLFVAKLFQWF